MVYCLNTDVYRIAGITSDNVASVNVDLFIQAATAEVERYCGTRWLFDARTELTGTASSATSTTLVDSSQTWTVDSFNDDYAVYIKSGTGSGQIRQISDNDATSVTVSTWDTTPDSTSGYEIFYAPLSTEVRDGTETDTIFTNEYPVFSLNTVTIDSTSVTPTNIYKYDSGKLVLSDDAEVGKWDGNTPQNNTITYYFGVRPNSRVKSLIKDFTASIAGIMALTTQIGGTFDDVTSYSLPEYTASKGEPYTNIREALMRIDNKLKALRPLIPRYGHFG